MTIILVATTILVVAAAVILIPLMMAKADKDVIIKIPKDATRNMVADSLSRHLGKDFSDNVMRLAKIRGTDFSKRHGAYLINEGMNAFMAQRRLQSGGQEPVRLVINGFRSIDLLAERISARLDFPSDSLKALLSDRNVMSRYGLTTEQALALFLNDTYEVYWTASPVDVIKKIGDNYIRVWNPERKRKASELFLSPADIMTICSIADQESNKADEKGKIGRLYINRLRSGMKLQADPTVRFALNDYTIKRVRNEHLKVNSPYNTYLHKGLPPGPICTTGTATIDSVLDSEPSEDLFMCAREDFSGYHNFANTYKEHIANALRYQHALDYRGIK